MRLELGSRVDCTDESFGKLVDVVIDPTSRRVTHLVVERDRDPWLARLVPVELAESGDDASGAVALRATVEEVRRFPPVHEVAYLRLDGFPVEDPDWDVGIEEVLALPYYPSYDLEPAARRLRRQVRPRPQGRGRDPPRKRRRVSERPPPRRRRRIPRRR